MYHYRHHLPTQHLSIMERWLKLFIVACVAAFLVVRNIQMAALLGAIIAGFDKFFM